MVQRRGRLRLAPEPGLERGVAGEVDAQDLDRDVAAEPQVAAAVHLGHAAAAEHLAELVPVAEQSRLSHGGTLFVEPVVAVTSDGRHGCFFSVGLH